MELALPVLQGLARACRRCPGVAAGSAVLGPASGPPNSRVMFVAEAPGYRGALRTGRPLCGDRSGDRFAAFCAAAGIRREDVFVTNAVLCHPRRVRPPDGRTGNRPPRASEVRHCADFLAAQVEAVRPRLVVALGRVALEAARCVAPHDLAFGRDVAVARPWVGRWLMSLYHPSGQTAGRRSQAQQQADYRAVARWLEGASPGG